MKKKKYRKMNKYEKRQTALLICIAAVIIALIVWIIYFILSDADDIENNSSPADSSAYSQTEAASAENTSGDTASEPEQDTEPTTDEARFAIENKNGMTYIDGILIANKSYSLPSDYDPGESSEALDAFYEMQADASDEGLNIYISSSYRSYEDQERIYQNYCDTDGQEAADTYSSRPGFSDHQTGLAFDLNSIDDSFGYTPESDWVSANCHKYGFIIRYPKGKEEITGYQYEPWHIRYIGVDKAAAVYESGLCLEEYLGIDSAYKE